MFGTFKALSEISFEVFEGEFICFLGPSGCGKTTTLRCVAGLETPDNDDAIIVRGRNLTGVAPKDRNLAFVFQTTALFPHINVRKKHIVWTEHEKNVQPRRNWPSR